MFQFNFSEDCEALAGTEDIESEPKEHALEWLPAQRHEVSPRHFTSPADGDVSEITVCNTKIQYLAQSFAMKRLQEKDVCNFSAALENHTDLVPAVYEGGLVIWECTWDLLQHLAALNINLKNKRVLELGCGAALPALYCGLQGAHITLQDYNEEVIDYVTIPNVALNLCSSSSSGSPTETGVHPSVTLSSTASFYSGDWEAVNQLLSRQQHDCGISKTENITQDEDKKFDLILTSETIYNPNCHKKLLDLMTAHLKQDGTILLAAKTHYFGVGGGTQQFADFVKAQDQLCVQSIVSNKSDDMIEQVWQAFQRSLQKSVRRASRELLPVATVWSVLRRRLQLTPSRLQLVQQLKDTDKPVRHEFCTDMLERLEEDGFDDRLVFSNEAIFHISGKVDKHNTRIWGTENPHVQ